jgi:hypothetical protein
VGIKELQAALAEGPGCCFWLLLLLLLGEWFRCRQAFSTSLNPIHPFPSLSPAAGEPWSCSLMTTLCGTSWGPRWPTHHAAQTPSARIKR